MVYTTRIVNIKKETEDTLTFFLETPVGFKYIAGQYGIFEHMIGEEIIRRSYSFSSSPTEQNLSITVRHIPNGKMTTYLFGLKIGESLTFNGAFGKFSIEGLKNVVLIGGGSGVTPFRAMAKYAKDTNSDTNIVLIYGARTQKEILFNDEFNSFLASPHFNLYISLDKPEKGWQFHTGFITADFIKEATKGEVSGKTYFLCGPPVMITSVKNALMGLGLPEEKIMIDAWG